MAQNHVWRYTLRLFHTFVIFGKSRKNDAKMALKIQPNWSKSRLWADFWHLIVDFFVFLSSVKKCWNFEVASEGQKIGKVHHSVAQRSPGCQRPVTFGRWGPQGGPARDQKSGNMYQEYRKQEKRKGRGI